MSTRDIENKAPKGYVEKDFPGASIECESYQSEDAVRTFVASDGGVDRDGDVIDPTGWDLDAYNKSGVFLWSHNRTVPPIATPLRAWIDGGKLLTSVRFPPPDLGHVFGTGFGHSVMRMYDLELIRSVSVGFAPIAWDYNKDRGAGAIDYHLQELLEVSAVDVPANPRAVMIAREAGVNVDPIIAALEYTRDNKAGISPDDMIVIKAALDSAKHTKKTEENILTAEYVLRVYHKLATEERDKVLSAVRENRETITQEDLRSIVNSAIERKIKQITGRL
jgi:hypothetical protein